MNPFLALIRRDLVLSLRQGGGVGTALGFFLTVVVLLPIGIGPDQALLGRIAPGALWIALLLSVLLSADRIYQQDFEDGSLDIMTMGHMPFELVAPAQLAARVHSLRGVPLALLAPASIGLEAGDHVVLRLDAPDTPQAYAQRLYAALRRLDAAGAARILVACPPQGPDWEAVLDRLRRAQAAH